MSNLKEYPSLLFVCDDLGRCADSLIRIYNDSCVRALSRADRVSLSIIAQKIRSHIATIHNHRVGCEKAMKILLETSLTDKEINDGLPF